MEMLDLYFRVKTGHRSFADEVLPVSLLHSLYEVETYVHWYNTAMILKTVRFTEDGEKE